MCYEAAAVHNQRHGVLCTECSLFGDAKKMCKECAWVTFKLDDMMMCGSCSNAIRTCVMNGSVELQ